ncbi:zinc metalloproteinase nas-15-like isoform X2 [Mizuhopecten yessoensis]|uniref:Metalloendopeptidase n=1 Tax=Mizuhopecten yessoensis TaxID=6573 RepID=A0A210QBC5_MIZYE|nr:zinc metalloproteinase nas-15-like isoform X2 [Mizuhopecten yessoensis]OWF46036.1 Bone morphogenetic protein 1-like [Mizuhopecten yessoensis]
MIFRLWLSIFLILNYSPSCDPNRHNSRANRILDRITKFIASDVAAESKAKLLGVLMNVSDTVPVTKTPQKPVTVPPQLVIGPGGKGGKASSLEPIDQLLMDAAEPGTAFNEPEILADSDVVKFDGDILMKLEQFAKIQRNVTLSLFEEALEKNLEQEKLNITLLEWINSLVPRSSSRKVRAARRDPRRFWRNGVVPIRIDSNNFRSNHKKRIARSMDRISEATCICFDIITKAEALAYKPHIRIIDGNGCRSYVGYSVRWGKGYLAQDLTLGRRCRRPRIAVHELLHALGLFHEQSRPDRNAFVDIKIENVIPRNRGNFNRFGRRTVNTRGVPYDYTSIMHYSNKAFSLNGEYTIIPKGSDNRDKYLDKIGRTRYMSRGDKAVLNIMYNCPSHTASAKPTCEDYPYNFPPDDPI